MRALNLPIGSSRSSVTPQVRAIARVMLLALSASRSLSAHAQVASSPDGGIPAAPAASASAEAEDRIVELRIEGNRRVEREAILRALLAMTERDRCYPMRDGRASGPTAAGMPSPPNKPNSRTTV